MLDNRDGKVWDITTLVPSLTYKTKRIGAPSSLDFTLIKDSPFQREAFKIGNGDVVLLRKDGVDVFYGYVFEVGFGKEESVTVKAYDQIRYLLGNDTYVFKDVTAADVVRKIAQDNGLALGRLDAPSYKIASMVEDNKKLLDMICKSLDLTLIHKGENYMLFDDFGKLSLRKLDDLKVDFVIGSSSLMIDFDYKASIDSETYNRIKIYQDNKESGKRDVHIAQDSANIAKWGRLQLYKQADEKMNAGQIREMLDQLLTLKNKEQRTIGIEALGDIRVRAGSYVPIIIDELEINQYFLVDECTHKLDADSHTMKLELRVV